MAREISPGIVVTSIQMEKSWYQINFKAARLSFEVTLRNDQDTLVDQFLKRLVDPTIRAKIDELKEALEPTSTAVRRIKSSDDEDEDEDEVEEP